MKTRLLRSLVLLCSLASASRLLAAEEASPATADTAAPPPSAPAKLSAAELEKLVMPIALHPDPLIAIILPASAYPLEIVQAARFVKDTNNIPKVDDQPWDDNVKEVAKFPEVVAMMDKDLPWTMDLGEAFIAQGEEVMNAIQTLRGKAQKAGNLKTSEQQIVTVTNIVVLQTNMTEVVSVTKEVVQVQPSNPQVIYVPTYPPAVYYPPAYAYAAPLVSFGVGMMWGAAIANNCNWGHGSVDVDVNKNVNRNTNRNTDRSQSGNRASNTSAKGGSQKWQPNQSRVQQSGAKASAGSANSRGWGGSSGAKPSTGNVGSRPSTGNTGARPSTGATGSRPSGGSGASTRPSTSQSASRGGASSKGSSPSASSRSSSGGSAFSGGSGSSARSSSSRGSSSRGSGGGGSRGGGGGGRGGGGGGRR